MGVIIVIKSLLNWFKKGPAGTRKQAWLFASPFVTAFAVGIIPCPGVVMVMLFAVSLNLTGLGIFLGSCIAAGMSLTITLTVIAGISGKSAILKLSDRHQKLRDVLEQSIETVAGFFVAAFGLILLLANL